MKNTTPGPGHGALDKRYTTRKYQVKNNTAEYTTHPTDKTDSEVQVMYLGHMIVCR